MRIAICSLRFAPGHAAHLRAYLELFSHLGCDTRLYLNGAYKGFIEPADGIVFTEQDDAALSWKPDAIISYNIANSNISLAKRCRKQGIKFYYVLHEPVSGLKQLISMRGRMPRRIAANYVNYRTAKNAYKVILASENGRTQYLETMKNCNGNYDVFPLIFCDDYDGSTSVERKYFSYIGGFTENRGSAAFLDFAKYALQRDPEIQFKIATRNALPAEMKSDVLDRARAEGRLKVFAGRPMTTEEINRHYRESVLTWNAYKRSTQSGVLPNALMQGTPLLVSDRPDVRECITDGREGRIISIPYDNEEIMRAYGYIRAHLAEIEAHARDCFLTHFHYSVYQDLAKKVFEVG